MALKMTDEARNKLKTIMRTKLVELVGHCEAELPDYIVSMIVNSKTKEYLVRNLEVFIGTKAEPFSDWLVDLQKKLAASAAERVEVKKEEEDVDMEFDEGVVESKPKEEVSRKRRTIDNEDNRRSDRHDSRSSATSDRPQCKVSRREEPRKESARDEERRKVVSSVVRPPSPTRRNVTSSVTVMRKIAPDNDDSAKTRPNIFRKAMGEALRPDSVRFQRNCDIENDIQKGDVRVEVDSKKPTRSAEATVKVRLDVSKAPLTNGDAQTQKPRIVWDLGKTEDYSGIQMRTEPVENDKAVVDALIAAVKLERAINNGDVYDEEAHFEDESVDKKRTRCSFWPKCMRGDDCAYVHPTVACRKFPRCAFGKFCLYVHPICKFGDACYNGECSAIHGDEEVVATICELLGTEPPTAAPSDEKQPVEGVLIEPAAGGKAHCHFANRCRNPVCTFIHPPECRYGVNCLSLGCGFRHPVNKYSLLKTPQS